ncbi:MAG: GtrA family protein [Bradymonadaceae bacterium]
MFKPKRHLLDLSTASVASFFATAVDGILFAQLLVWARAYAMSDVIGIAAATAAMLGGVTHFILCRYWVFQRYDKPLRESIIAYLFMSGGAALAHGLTTHMLAIYGGATAAWFLSKAVIFIFWTYPVSRFVVFGQPSNP